MLNLYSTLHLTAIEIQYLIAIEMNKRKIKELSVLRLDLNFLSKRCVCIYIYISLLKQLVSFCLLYLSSFTYLFIFTEDPVNSKRILFTAGMVGDYSGLSTLYIYMCVCVLQ